ncbi:M1 family aminopeptidase [Aquimarina muelleri]|uniref:M1 family aminopeptidase n=1 Tax=Aquimarina muelleri TaxID=279356 RepID=UPI003F682B6A
MKLNIIITLLLTVHLIQAQQPNEITYEIGFSEKPNPHLEISVIFVTDPYSEKTSFFFPNSHWGQDSLRNCLKNLRFSENITETKFSTDSIIQVYHKKGTNAIRLDYTIEQDRGKEITYGNFRRPIVQPNYFHVHTHSLFLLPDINPEDNLKITIDWKTPNQNYHNSFGTNIKHQIIQTTRKKFEESVHIGGDYRLYDQYIKNKKVSIAIRDIWVPFDDTKITAFLKEITNGLRTFWNDFDKEDYLIVVSPMNNFKGKGYTGTGMTNSFTAALSNNSYIKDKDLLQLFNHEMVHDWIGISILNDNEEEQYWFSEGFTDYINFKLAATYSFTKNRNSYFTKKLNVTMLELLISKSKNIKNKEITYEKYWSDYNTQIIPYKRGTLFAFLLDLKICSISKGKLKLDDLLRAILKDAKKNGQKLDHPYFISKANEFLKEDITPFFNRYIENGEDLPLQQTFDQYKLKYELTSYKNKKEKHFENIPKILENQDNKLLNLLFE